LDTTWLERINQYNSAREGK